METITHTRENYGLKKGAEDFPLHIALSVAYVCNSKCVHCVYIKNPELRDRMIAKGYAFMPFAIFKKIADEAGKYNSFIRLSGGGEPLLHKDLLKMVKYGKNKGARIGLITNGMLLNKKAAESLLESGIDAIEISVDAASKKLYSTIRKGLDFDTVKSNIEYCVEKRNKTGKTTLILVSIINQKTMWKTMWKTVLKIKSSAGQGRIIQKTNGLKLRSVMR